MVFALLQLLLPLQILTNHNLGGVLLTLTTQFFLLVFLPRVSFGIGLGSKNQGVVALLHPAMTLGTFHTLGALRGLDGFYLIGEVPFVALDGVVLIEGRFSPIVLNVVGIGTV